MRMQHVRELKRTPGGFPTCPPDLELNLAKVGNDTANLVID